MFDLDESKSAKNGRGGIPKLYLLIGAAVLVIVVVVVCVLLFGRGDRSKADPEPVITSDLLKSQLIAIEELGTAAYYYTGVGKFENQSEFFGWKVPFTDKTFIVTYDGVIKAGINLRNVDVSVNETKKSITVVLPQCEFLSHEIDEDSIQVLDESDGLFNSITIEDYVGFSSEQKDVMAQRAIDNGLLKEAEANACTTIEAFLSLVPGIEQYTVTIRVSS